MERPSGIILLGFLVVVLAVQAALLFGKGVLLIDQHEGDAIHVLSIALRMGQGQLPHLDFMTPLGILSFAPIAWLISLGLGVGHAIMGAFVLFAALILAPVWWAAWSRLSGWLAYAFGGFIIILCTALAYGGADQVASISMFYNRWGWAVAFVLVILSVLPSKSPNQGIDGVVLGLGLGWLALAKITFFVAFLPGVLVALLLRRQWTALLTGVLAGLILAGIVTLFTGVAFWGAYLGDLSAVSSGPIRAAPGANIATLLLSPVFVVMNICLILGIVLIRQAGQATEGLILILFAPAFIYTTYQNWGNDPKWLILMTVLLLTLRPDRHLNNAFGWDIARAMGVVSLVSIALILPTILTLIFADLRHARLSQTQFVPILQGHKNSDLKMRADRMFAPVRRTAFALDNPEVVTLLGARQTSVAPDLLFGQPMPVCKLAMGLVGTMMEMARDIDAFGGMDGKSIFVADTFSSLWLFGSTVPVPHGAPWFYGGDTGLTEADYVLIPLCPVTYDARKIVLETLQARPEIHLREVMRTELFVLLQRLPD